jgi:hypothetical protein
MTEKHYREKDWHFQIPEKSYRNAKKLEIHEKKTFSI